MSQTLRETVTGGVTMMTFQDLVDLEPKLQILWTDFRSADVNRRWRKDFCANELYYEYKPSMVALIGWNRGKAKGFYQPTPSDDEATLKSREAYDVVVSHLWDTLSPCRECNCV